MKTTFSKLLFATMLVAAMIASISHSQAQTKEELQTLLENCRREADAARSRAEKAEADAKVLQKLAVAAQLKAEENAEKARLLERKALRARYLAGAKAMAVKSTVLEGDPMLVALVARQAYSFHLAYEGNSQDNDISNGLNAALKRFNDTSPGLDLAGRAALVCKHVNRNMTREEWDKFVGSDLPYERTCENLPANNK